MHQIEVPVSEGDYKEIQFYDTIVVPSFVNRFFIVSISDGDSRRRFCIDLSRPGFEILGSRMCNVTRITNMIRELVL